MFLSDFSIKRPVAADRHHHHADGAGPDRAEQAARQPDPGCRAAGDRGQHQLPGRVARHGRARDRQPHRTGACRASRASTSRARRQLPAKSYAQLRARVRVPQGHDAGLRRDPQRDRQRCATSCRWRCASRCSRGSIRARSRSCRSRSSSPTMSHAEISRLAEDQLADRFRALPGVATVNVNGSLTRELSVLLHAQKLREFGVSVTEVVDALRAQNATAPVGKVRGELEDQSIRLVGRFESPAEFNQMLIKRSGDNLIRLGQVATVQDGFAETGRATASTTGVPMSGMAVTRTRDGQHREHRQGSARPRRRRSTRSRRARTEARHHAGRRPRRAEQPGQRRRIRCSSAPA